MEIHKTDSQPQVKDYKIKSKKEKAAEGSSVDALQSPFLDELKKLALPDEPSPADSTLEEVMAELDRQGRQFQDKPILDELVKYKALVKRFLDLTVKKALRLDKHQGARRLSATQKTYSTVAVIDKKLSELTLVVLDRESRNINLAARLDEIRGLLLDLYR